MKIVVTGAMGHIGSRLLQVFPREFPEAKVTALVRSFREETFPNQTVVECDLNESFNPEVLRGADAVVHLAATTNAHYTREVQKKNFGATHRVACASAEAAVPLLFLSTTSVYGTNGSGLEEACPDLKPQSPYAESKLEEERVLQLLAETQGLRFTVLRCGTVFGLSPGMRFHTAVNRFCWQVSFQKPVTVWRTSMDQMRPYLDVEDAVRAIVLVLGRMRFEGETFNLTTDNSTVRKILEIIHGYQDNFAVKYVEDPLMNSLSYGVSRARFAALGFEFRGSLKRGIGETLQVLRGIRENGIQERSALRFAQTEVF